MNRVAVPQNQSRTVNHNSQQVESHGRAMQKTRIEQPPWVVGCGGKRTQYRKWTEVERHHTVDHGPEPEVKGNKMYWRGDERRNGATQTAGWVAKSEETSRLWLRRCLPEGLCVVMASVTDRPPSRKGSHFSKSAHIFVFMRKGCRTGVVMMMMMMMGYVPGMRTKSDTRHCHGGAELAHTETHRMWLLLIPLFRFS